MAFSPTSNPTLPRQPRAWGASIGSGDTTNWKLLLNASGGGAGANGSKVTALNATSSDTVSRVVQIARARSAPVTVTSASPGVVTWAGHNLANGDLVMFTAATMPTGLSANVGYYVVNTNVAAGTFQVAATAGGTAINTSSTGTTVVAYSLRINGAVTIQASAGTNGTVGAANIFSPLTGFPFMPIDNDGQPYWFGESGDYLAVASTATITANTLIAFDAPSVADF